ncbi:hypothetical protein SLEP1_g17392 [Rubroshorea leprosula]|uniref:Uncharacterized protein n=1 Tax=Rubroshorea leprosula TaxID=152421 RepID=A0AAV5J1P7_9ROSI|nr:hypothetical protein SLEP1_g17392 [Rubroshorea leprosula]
MLPKLPSSSLFFHFQQPSKNPVEEALFKIIEVLPASAAASSSTNKLLENRPRSRQKNRRQIAGNRLSLLPKTEKLSGGEGEVIGDEGWSVSGDRKWLS